MSEQPTGTIVVGIDGSENSHEALAWAVQEARFRSARLKLIHSWTFPAATPGSDGLPHADFAAAAEKVLDEAIAAVGDAAVGLAIEREVAAETPARCLVAASENADIVVIGSRGLGGFKGMLLGSVTQQVANHAKCPVVIVPHAERRA